MKIVKIVKEVSRSKTKKKIKSVKTVEINLSDKVEQEKNGVGTIIKGLFEQLGVTPKKNCNCLKVMQEMNEAGPEGCLERADYFLEALRKNAENYSYVDRVKAVVNAGRGYVKDRKKNKDLPYIVLNIDMKDPIKWLFYEAIRIAQNEPST